MDISKLPVDPRKRLRITGVHTSTNIEVTASPESIKNKIEWVDVDTDSPNEFGIAQGEPEEGGVIRVYASNKIDCIGYNNPITSYHVLNDAICELQRRGICANSEYTIRINNILAQTVVGSGVDLYTLNSRIPKWTSPPEEGSLTVDFELDRNDIETGRFHESRVDELTIAVSIDQTGLIQIFGATHPAMLNSVVLKLTEYFTQDCLR